MADLKAAHFIKVAPLLDLEIFQVGLNRFARASAVRSQCNGFSFFLWSDAGLPLVSVIPIFYR